MAEINVNAPVTIQLTEKDVAAVLMDVIFERLDRTHDAGCDFVTGASGDTYISYPNGDVAISENPDVAALVDAANILQHGKMLHT